MIESVRSDARRRIPLALSGLAGALGAAAERGLDGGSAEHLSVLAMFLLAARRKGLSQLVP